MYCRLEKSTVEKSMIERGEERVVRFFPLSCSIISIIHILSRDWGEGG